MKISFILSNKINRYTLFYLFGFILIYIWYYRLECGIFTYFFQINQRCVHDLFNQCNGQFYNSIYRRGRVWHNFLSRGRFAPKERDFFLPPSPVFYSRGTTQIVDFCHLKKNPYPIILVAQNCIKKDLEFFFFFHLRKLLRFWGIFQYCVSAEQYLT